MCAGTRTESARVFCLQSMPHTGQKLINIVNRKIEAYWGSGEVTTEHGGLPALHWLWKGWRVRESAMRDTCSKSYQTSMLFSRTMDLKLGERPVCGRIYDTRAVREGIW